eukprot:8894971-Karenia_brevis.AAC.1
MSVNLGSRVAPTFGKPQCRYRCRTTLVSWALGPLGLGPYALVLGPAVQQFSDDKSWPRYKRREEYKRASEPGGFENRGPGPGPQGPINKLAR